MTLPAVNDADARHLFTTLRDSTFGWTVEHLDSVINDLGWTIAEQIPGKGAIADTPWGIPDADAELLYQGDAVRSMTIAVTGHAHTDADRLAVIDTFARLAALATDVYGQPATTIKGSNPRLRWRTATTAITLQNVGSSVLVLWATNDFQDHLDDIGQS